MQSFLAMGGYAGYVWPAYGSALVVVAALSLRVWLQRRRIHSQLRSRHAPTA